jgi:hypothetical protein
MLRSLSLVFWRDGGVSKSFLIEIFFLINGQVSCFATTQPQKRRRSPDGGCTSVIIQKLILIFVRFLTKFTSFFRCLYRR